MKQVAVITGGSSGIGLASARLLAEKGYIVYELSRREHSQPGVIHITADVTREETLEAAAGQILREQGQVDVVVNNAGFGISGAVEFTRTEEAQRQFDVNFFGMVRVNRVFLPILRKQGRGRIVNVSSVAGPVAIPFQAFYSAAKAAVESYTLALANEVRPYGVTVCAVRPGDIRTGFTAARSKCAVGDEVYGGRISRSVAVMELDEQGGMTPEQAARAVVWAASCRRPKPLTAIGVQYKGVCLLVKLLPCRTANWIVGKIYAK